MQSQSRSGTPTAPPPSEARAVVVVFTIEGCEACKEYKPTFMKVANGYRNSVPIYMLDANSTDPQVASLAQRLNVQAVPATFVLRKPTGMIKVEGAIPADQVVWLCDIAARENSY